MERFSVRNGYALFNNMNACQLSTRKRIWQVFAHDVFLSDKQQKAKYDIVEDILSYFGQSYDYSNHFQDHINNCNDLEHFLSQEAEWYQIYDFIEYHLKHSDDAELINKYNEILNDEKTGYHIIGNIIVPITNGFEISQIEETIAKSPEHVVESFNKSLALFSDRNNPDYNNSIKESITAVEALCCTIVEGSADTLGQAVNRIKDYGIILNEHLATSIKELYKYTCNEDGKRHGGTTYIESDVEDAKFMILTCSAIINYLVIKWEKAKEKKE